MAQQYFRSILKFDYLFRIKRVDNDDIGETKLARVLNTLDLTALGKSNLLNNFKLP